MTWQDTIEQSVAGPIGYVHDSDTGQEVCVLFTDKDQDRNVKLIAAGPELLTTLKAILTAAEIDEDSVFEGADSLPVYDDGSWFTLGLLRRIRATIAKAEEAR